MSSRERALETLVGTTIAGKYKLVSLLGVGGMGVVYQAEQLGLGRSVAVKLLTTDRMGGTEWFRAEAMAASRINHPHAVSIYDFGVTESDVPYLAMEHLRGQCLADVIEAEPMSVERVVTLGAQILSALSEAHSCGVVHCDLTSDNVIIEHLRDGDDFAKVIDFGLARVFGSSHGDAIVGTPEYMAPEQIRGLDVGPPVDVYAVGALLFEMIVGRTPFAGSSVQVILNGHLRAAPMAPHEAVASCPRALGELILRALSKSPEDRPTSARAMRDELLSVLGVERSASRCATCGHRASRAQRFCGNCGAEAHASTADELLPPNEFLAVGSRPLRRTRTGQQPRRSKARQRRTTRLTCDLDTRRGLIGRTAELDTLLTFCRRGRVSSMAIVGPAGIGKARLLMEARERLSLPIFVAACDPSGLRTSWYPVLSILEQLFELGNEISLEDLSRAVAQSGLPDRDVPGLAEIFGIPSPSHELELAVRRREAHAAALRALTAITRRYPRAVLCFADFDRYDAPSRALVRELAGAVKAGSARVIITSAESECLRDDTEELVLSPLSADDSLEMTVRLSGGSAPIPPSEVIASLTGGLPAAVEQLAGWLRMGNSAATAPSLLVDLVSVRVSRMPTAARRVMQAVAVHGSVAPRWLVEATLGSPEPLALIDARWSGLLRLDDEWITIPFELVASVINACTPADVLRSLHRRAFAALRDKAPPSIVGQHAEGAGELDAAYQCYVAAGRDAVSRFDDSGAARCYGRAVAVARRIQSRGNFDAVPKFIDASVLLADVLQRSRQSGLSTGVLDEAEMFQPDDAQRAAMERIRGHIAVDAGDAGAGVGHLRLSVGMALRTGDRALLLEAYIDLARALDRLGRVQAGIDELQQGVDVITLGEGLPHVGGPSGLWRIGLHIAERQFELHRVVEATASATAALEQARREQSARGRGRLSALLACILESAGESAAAMRHRSNAIDVLRKLGDRRSTAELLLEDAGAGAHVATTPATTQWSAQPMRGVRMAAKLAAEVGWTEGVALSKRASTQRDE